jgi:hypothetical protein
MLLTFTLSEVKLVNKLIVALFMIATLVDWILYFRKGR